LELNYKILTDTNTIWGNFKTI